MFKRQRLDLGEDTSSGKKRTSDGYVTLARPALVLLFEVFGYFFRLFFVVVVLFLTSRANVEQSHDVQIASLCWKCTFVPIMTRPADCRVFIVRVARWSNKSLAYRRLAKPASKQARLSRSARGYVLASASRGAVSEGRNDVFHQPKSTCFND